MDETRPPTLAEILDVELLAKHLDDGNIGMQRHPTEPLRILNYTARCQYNGAWDEVTRACRGLIVDDDDGVRARPFPKFHNLHEHAEGSAAGTIELAPPLLVIDKLDGSLGIAYRRPSDNRIAWSTRGSFVSDQAKWATEWWAGNLPVEHYTYLAEIIYPDNRIVVDYGDQANLTLLAVLDIASGKQLAPIHPTDSEPILETWPFGVVDTFGATADLGTIDRNARPDAEGYVVLSADHLTRVKLKADEYMRLHKLLTGVSNRTIWELLANGKSLASLIDRVPDEFADWLKATAADLQQQHAALTAAVAAEYQEAITACPVRRREDRGDFARAIANSPNRSLLFALLDGKPTSPLVWKLIKPERALPYTVDSETS